MDRRSYIGLLFSAGLCSMPAYLVYIREGASFNWHNTEKELYKSSDGYQLDIIFTVSTDSDSKWGRFHSDMQIFDESEEVLYADTDFNFFIPESGKTRVRESFSTSYDMSLDTMRRINQNKVSIHINFYTGSLSKDAKTYKLQC